MYCRVGSTSWLMTHARAIFFRLLLLLTTILALVVPITATPVLSEDFSYPLGELNGQSGGTGLGPWTAITAITEIVDPGSPLVYAVPGGGVVNGGNRALMITGNGDNALYSSLAVPSSSNEVFISFLFQFVSGTIEDNDFAAFWFDNVTTGTHTTVPSLGLKSNRGNGSGVEDLMARERLGSEVYATNITLGSTYFIVGRLWKSTPGSGNNYNRFDLWVNPAFGDMLTPLATSSGPGSIASFGVLGLRSVNIDAGEVILFDSLRAGTSWSDVVPSAAPEPGSFAICGLALLVLGFRKLFSS